MKSYQSNYSSKDFKEIRGHDKAVLGFKGYFI